MTVQEIFSYTSDVINKDLQGLAFGPDQFNNLLKFENIELFQESFAKAKATAAQGGEKLSSVLFTVHDLRNFITTELLSLSQIPIGTLTLGNATYPDDMEYPMFLWGSGKDIELVPVSELGKIRGSVLHRSYSERPIAIAKDGMFEFYPNDIGEVLLTYLKRPSTPYYDYCTDANDITVFMPAGSYIQYKLVPNYYILYDSLGNTLATDVTHTYFGVLSPNPLITYTSLTAELEWEDTKHMYIANRILEKMGVNLRSPEVTQYASSK